MEKATTEEIRLILKMISKGYKVPKVIHDVVFDIAKRDIEEAGKVVIYKRDPNIHSSRAQGAYVKIIEDDTLEVHPTAAGGFGFDHDGDTMAIYAPMSEEAQQEVKDKMISVTDKSSTNVPMFELTKDMLVGIFTLTAEHKEKSILKNIKTVKEAEELHIGHNVSINMKGEKLKTTAGRVVFNDALPNWYSFVNEDVNKKIINKIMDNLLEKSQNDFAVTIDKLMRLGFKYATLYPKTLDLRTLVIPSHIMKMKEELSTAKTVSEQSNIQDKIEVSMMDHFKKTHSDLYFIVASGGSKGMNQIRQMMVCKGLIQDPEGNILPPIIKSINEGYSPQEYFDAAAGSRKGTTDRALNTGNGGYAYRKMIFCVGNVQADINNGNCGTHRTLDIKLTKELFRRMSGRFVHDEEGNIKLISKDMVGQIIKLRSPIFCKSRKICKTCYGNLLKQMNSENVGMIAAQEVTSLSEKIMKSAVGLVLYKDKLFTINDLWDSIHSDIIKNDDLETKIFEDEIGGKNGLVKTSCIQKHPPKDKMLFISTKSGHTMVCQADHPLWIKKNQLHEKYDNRTCRLTEDRIYTSWGSGRSKSFEIKDEEQIEKEARYIRKYDAIWIDNTFPVNNSDNIIPEINGYLVGIYCGDGFKLDYEDRWTKGFDIAQLDGYVKDRIIKESYQYDKFNVNWRNITYKDPSFKINKIILGRYAWTKRLEPEFINYSKEWLRDFIAGYIDSDGTVFDKNGKIEKGTCCRIYTSSYNLVQQLKMICLKLGYSMNTNIVVCNIKTKKAIKHKRVHFSCDIRFPEGAILPDSEKLKNLNAVRYSSYKKEEFPLKGFDVISCIKEIWKWEYPVYDIKTETKEFLLGCVQNHNSFHLGGAVILNKLDIINEFMDELSDLVEPKLRKSVKQEENDLINLLDLAIIRIDKRIYIHTPIKKEDDHYNMPVGHFNLILGDLEVPVALEKPTKIYIPAEVEEDDTYISLMYAKDDKILYIEPTQENFSDLARYLDTLVGGKYPWQNVATVYKKFFKALSSTGGWDSVHLEVIISNIMRAKSDPQKPARLIEPFDPVMYSVKTLPNVISWSLGISFENWSKGIQYGMISERGPESSIEKVLMGMSLSEKGE